MAAVGDRYGPAAVPASATTAFTVTSSHTYMLLDITVVNTTSGPLNFTMSIGSDATTTRLYDAATIAGKSSMNWTGRRIMKTGEIMQVFGSATGLTITVSYIDLS